MLTIFSLPKAFRGHIDTIQRNAICSWRLLDPQLQIILFGSEWGTREVARELQIDHVPGVCCNDYGTPLVSDLFTKAQERAEHNILCFVNTDVIFMRDFLVATKSLFDLNSFFLMVGECYDLDVKTRLEFDGNLWEENLRTLVLACGMLRGKLAMDYFVFPSGLFDIISPFAIGRSRYDNWFIWKALKSGAMVINATDSVCTIHQKHDYSHVSGGKRWCMRGSEAKHNQRLAGFARYVHLYSLFDATHSLANGIQKKTFKFALVRQIWARFRASLREKCTTRA
jgi:hypothetical protein